MDSTCSINGSKQFHAGEEGECANTLVHYSSTPGNGVPGIGISSTGPRELLNRLPEPHSIEFLTLQLEQYIEAKEVAEEGNPELVPLMLSLIEVILDTASPATASPFLVSLFDKLRLSLGVTNMPPKNYMVSFPRHTQTFASHTFLHAQQRLWKCPPKSHAHTLIWGEKHWIVWPIACRLLYCPDVFRVPSALEGAERHKQCGLC